MSGAGALLAIGPTLPPPPLGAPLSPQPGAWAALLCTPLSLLLLGLLILNLVALQRPASLLSRGVGAALLLPLLLLLALPLPGPALGPLLQGVIPVLTLLLLAALLRPQGNAGPPPNVQPATDDGPGAAHCPSDGGEAAGPDPSDGSTRAYWLTAIAASLAIGLLLALRPHPFEYPGDSTDYLQGFIQAQLEPPPPRSCLVAGLRQPTYQRFCTLWSVVLQAGHLDPAVLLGGLPQRLTILLEVSVLGLSSFRLLQAAGVGAAAAALSWLLVAFGLGNQAINFLVNHALQGSILAAAVFLEAVMVMLRLLRWRTAPLRQAGAVVAALLVFLLLTMKLHGAFALCTLALLVPLQALIGAARLGGHLQRPGAFAALARPTARWLLLSSLGLLALVLSLKTGWLLNKQARFIVPWSFLGALGLPPHALPGSFLMRTPGSRPEALAVAGIVVGIVHLARSWRPGSAAEPAVPRQATSPPAGSPTAAPAASGAPTPAEPTAPATGPGTQASGSTGGEAEAELYALVASLYGVAVLLAFLLPPFSHLFINLPYEVISNYRLMWGSILFSPLPCLLQRAIGGRWPLRAGVDRGAAGRRALLPGLLSALISALVLIPVPGGSRRQPQLFWSKSRHLLEGPQARLDLMVIARALLPSLAAAPPQPGGPPVVLADEQIASALSPWTPLLRPTHPIRVYTRHDLQDRRQWDTQAPLRAAATPAERLQVLTTLESRPSLVVQQRPFDATASYSPYSEIGVYEPDIVSLVSATSVNALRPAELEAAGFRLWRRLDGAGDPLAADASEEREVFRIWRRPPSP